MQGVQVQSLVPEKILYAVMHGFSLATQIISYRIFQVDNLPHAAFVP